MNIPTSTFFVIFMLLSCSQKVVVHDTKYDFSFHYKSQNDTASIHPYLNIVITKLKKNKIIISSVIDSTSELKIIRTESNLVNPFSPYWHVDFQLLKNGHLTITFLDNKAHLISELFNGTLETGVYEMGLAENNLVSGFYFFEFKFNDQKLKVKIPMIK